MHAVSDDNSVARYINILILKLALNVIGFSINFMLIHYWCSFLQFSDHFISEKAFDAMLYSKYSDLWMVNISL